MLLLGLFKDEQGSSERARGFRWSREGRAEDQRKSHNFESVLREASRRGVYVQIFNPDVHTVNYFSQRGLNSNDASLVVQALTSKKTEIALKTELHACILARVNKNGSELPYVTLERNISIIVGTIV